MPQFLTDEQQLALAAAGDAPLPILDPQSQRIFYLVSADQLERIRLLISDDEFQPSELYPLISKTAHDAGWSDPTMDEYDRYDENRPHG